MKRVLKLLAKLYPSAWRRRYGSEYEALLEERTPRAQDAIDVFWGAIKMQLTSWSFVRIVLPCALAGVLVAMAISFAVPPHYSSEKSLTVITTDTSANALVVNDARNAFSRDFLASVIQKRNLYLRERGRMPLNDVIDTMQGNIRFRAIPVTSPTAWSGFEGLSFLPIQPGKLEPINVVVQFDYSDPHVAQQVDLDLVKELLFGVPRRGPVWIGPDPAFRLTKESLNAYLRSGASLPKNPSGLSQIQFGSIGLFAGLLCGLILATILPSQHNTTVANG
jgi:hypothetical protein